jgi:hypothetical protein
VGFLGGSPPRLLLAAAKGGRHSRSRRHFDQVFYRKKTIELVILMGLEIWKMCGVEIAEVKMEEFYPGEFYPEIILRCGTVSEN